MKRSWRRVVIFGEMEDHVVMSCKRRCEGLMGDLNGSGGRW